MTEPDGALAAMVGNYLGTADPVDPEWFLAVCEHMTADEIAAAVDYGMELRGTPEVWRTLVATENRADAAILAGR